MTIASAFNDITEKLGGTPSNSGTIASAIDALNDVLAGSDQPAVQTIEGAVALLGEHIGGGSSVTVEALTATENKTYTAPEGKAYSPVTVNVSGGATWGVPTFISFDIDSNTVFPTLWVYDKAFPAAQDDSCFGIFLSKDNSNMAVVPSGLYMMIMLDGSFEVTGMTLDGAAFTDYTVQDSAVQLQVPVSTDQNKGLVIAVEAL